MFGVETERNVVKHITSKDWGRWDSLQIELFRSISYKFAVELHVPYKFINKEELAEYVWLKSFMHRNSDAAQRGEEAEPNARKSSASN